MKPALRAAGILLLLAGAVTGAYVTGRVSAQRALVTPDEINTVEVTQKALQAVVRVDNRLRKDVLQPGDDPVETGSGFFYKQNLIVTNYHVIQDQESVSVTLYNGRRVPARVEGIDPGIDIAILRVTGVTAPKTLSFGRSAGLIPGQKLITIGTPLKIQNFVTTGVFSVLASARDVPRNDQLGQEIGQYLITSANIQQGNSGGPVLDSRGAVVGVADANAAPNSFVPGVIGIAIPGDLVRQSLDDLEKIGVPQRGTLGVTLVDLDSLDPALRQLAGLSSSEGALVDEVPAGTAGARAGLRGSLRNSRGQLLAPLGDVIVSVDGQRVRNSFDVIRLVAAKRPGQTVTLRVWRNKKPVDVKVTLQKRTLQ
ncbi:MULTISPECIES: S1C family serine protease [Deinococcus]|uniref:Peptidase S1 and S6, chymotrypsin/Hap n=1 Tax=Deinococcus geothermalis (strain DSM 11300 / CIP 105573 / AG-3a) TaxID=319795 RepID=Q1J278_DEIGD|nr:MULTISPECIES: S1C family serine protease [Deinococcus]ABF44406.1 peptidase S1 and S6, chymotrypsin/Hap [Deinococcus geothermalis DSM 11300]